MQNQNQSSQRRLTTRPAFGILLLGVIAVALAFAPMLAFYSMPHENGVASDYWAQLDVAPITFLGLAIGSPVAVISALRLAFFKPGQK